MNPLKILIVEDEILIADLIKRYLIQKGYQVIGIAISYEEAEQFFLDHQSDLILLDIKINSERNGIDFGRFLQSHAQPKPFIYLTSQMDESNINKAKETFPAAYILKPIQKERLYATIEIVMHNHQAQVQQVPSILLNNGKIKELIPISRILYLESDHVYVKIYLNNDQVVLERTALKKLLLLLPANQFLQIHRRFVVNVVHVKSWNTEFLFINEQSLPISRSFRKKVLLSLK